MVDFIIMIIIRSSALLLVALAINKLLFRNSPITRSFVYRLTFISILLLPLLSQIIPQYDIPILNFFQSFDSSIAGSSQISSLVTLDIINEQTSLFNWLNILKICWVIGASLVLMRILIGETITHKIIKNSSAISTRHLKKMIESIQLENKIEHSFDTRLSNQTTVPFITGLIKQTIILPHSFPDWNIDKQKMVLIHEIAHIERKDIIWFLISSCCSVLYWFNPLIWICQKKLIIDTEIVCDNFVLTEGHNAKSYAEHLLTLAKNLKYNLFVSPVNPTMARKTQLEGRLMSILTDQKRINKLSQSNSKLIISLSVIIVLLLSSFQIFANDSEKNNSDKDKYEIGVVEKQTYKIATTPKKNYLISSTNKKDEVYPKSDEFVKLDSVPEMIKMVNPEYPKEAKKKGIEGDVWIKSLIDKEGKVIKAIVSKSSGNKMLDKSALDAARDCKFSPGIQDDKPVACWISYKITFKLDEKK